VIYIVKEVRHRTGRERIFFADDSSRQEGRGFLRRLAKAGRNVRDYEEPVSLSRYWKAGISFHDLWSLNVFGHENPSAAEFAKWRGKHDAVKRVADQCRETAAGIRSMLGLRVGPLRRIRVDEEFRLVLDDQGEPVLEDESSVLNRVFVPPWPPSLGRKLSVMPDDLDALAAALEQASLVLRRPPHAPQKEREREFRLEWYRLAKDRSRHPLDPLGATLFNTVFEKRVSHETFERQRQLDQRRKKVQ